MVWLFGRLDSPLLSECLSVFQRQLVPRLASAGSGGPLDARLAGFGVGEAPAVFQAALQRTAKSLSYPLYLDSHGSMVRARR